MDLTKKLSDIKIKSEDNSNKILFSVREISNLLKITGFYKKI